jgi:outer membrane receptor protein involved in Fe transport
MRIYFIVLSFLIVSFANAQNVVSGTVTDAAGQPIPGVRVQVTNISTAYSYTDFTGVFSIKTNSNFPLSILVSMLGYENQTLEVKSEDRESLKIILVEVATSLEEIVVSASRTAEKLIESPVTIERMNSKQIKNTTGSTFYEGLENLKELHVNTGSFAFKSINTRGFANAANPRFMQLVDGMENTSPSLNVVIGNLVGMSELDVESIEVLLGASSALYGANAFNGILFMNSISPFSKQGISAYVKTGQTSQEAAGTNAFYDFGVRGAYKFSEKFALKANVSYLTAKDWIANDNRNVAPIGKSLSTNQFNDALNSYGDEIFTFIPAQAGGTVNVGLVSRTPYRDQDLNDNKVENFKIDASLNYKPFGDDLEIILQHKMGFGTTNYSASDARTRLQGFQLRQTKLEIKGKNFFIRTYLTGQDSGDSYSMTRAAWNINAQSKSNKEWFTDFTRAFVAYELANGTNSNISSFYARQYADYNIIPTGVTTLPAATGKPRFEPGSTEYVNAFNTIIASDNSSTGAKFTDLSSFHHTEGNYNFKDIISFSELQLGGSYRKYNLDSRGTVFTDRDSDIKISEYGIYSQLQKKFLDERLKLTGSVRYDKSSNFNGNFSPRISMSYSFGKNKQRNLRASFQTGFRNPTTQDQYSGLNIGAIAAIGSAQDNLTRFSEVLTVNQAFQNVGQPSTITLSGDKAYNNSFSYASVQDYIQSIFLGAPDATILKATVVTPVKPEKVKSFELGYRADISNFIIDLNGYYNSYNDFITQKKVITPYYGKTNGGTAAEYSLAVIAIPNTDVRTYQVFTNSATEVSSLGIGVGLSKKLGKYDVGMSYNYATIDYDATVDPDFAPGFNTPKSRFKASIGNESLFKNFGFNTNLRWNSEYLWQSSIGSGMIPENLVFDAQVDYSIPSFKSIIKIGGTNLFGKDYLQVFGAGQIGQQLYASWTFNP